MGELGDIFEFCIRTGLDMNTDTDTDIHQAMIPISISIPLASNTMHPI
jgi:hypothetical protein